MVEEAGFVIKKKCVRGELGTVAEKAADNWKEGISSIESRILQLRNIKCKSPHLRYFDEGLL